MSVKNKAIDYLLLENGTIRINLKELETILKEQLEKLARADFYDLKLYFGYEMIGVQFPKKDNPSFSAICKKQNQLTNIPFNVALFAGGSKDQMRDLFLGLPNELTKPKGYGVAIFLKKETIFEGLQVSNGSKKCELKYADFAKELNKFKSKFTKLIDVMSPPISDKLKVKYADLLAEIKNKPSESELIVAYIIENVPTIAVCTELPTPLEEFIEELKKEKESIIEDQQIKNLDSFKLAFNKLFLGIVSNYVFASQNLATDKPILVNMEEKSDLNRLSFDPNPINVSTFMSSMKSLENALYEYKTPEVPHVYAYMLAVGDSMNNLQFYSGHAIEVGMRSVENAVNILVNRDTGVFKDYTEMIKSMNKEKKKLTQTAYDYSIAVHLAAAKTKQDKNYLAVQNMKNEVLRLVNTDATYKYGFDIGQVVDSADRFSFAIYIIRKKTIYPAIVTDEGKIKINKCIFNCKKVFDTVIQAFNFINNM